MARYAASNEAISAANKQSDTTAAAGGVVGVNAQTTATTRAWIYDLMWGCYGDTPADNDINYQVNRTTGTTATLSGVPTPMDMDTVAAGSRILERPYTSLSVTAESCLLNLGANMRSTQRWVAAPGGELVLSKTNSAGILFSAVTDSGNLQVEAVMHFWE
jgi:hypothetical protein